MNSNPPLPIIFLTAPLYIRTDNKYASWLANKYALNNSFGPGYKVDRSYWEDIRSNFQDDFNNWDTE